MSIRVFLSGMLVLAATQAAPAKQLCTVADPTATPLNVRVYPNRAILSTLRNGTTVAVPSQAIVEGKRWAYVGIERDFAPTGWVFEDYLSCSFT
jgi:hypothetical protein